MQRTVISAAALGEGGHRGRARRLIAVAAKHASREPSSPPFKIPAEASPPFASGSRIFA
jgi:hypothetical protein